MPLIYFCADFLMISVEKTVNYFTLTLEVKYEHDPKL